MKKINRMEKTLGFSNIETVLKNKKKNEKKAKSGTYKGIKELKKDLEENDRIKKEFESVKNQEEAIKLARKLGYKISEEEIAESMLKSVAGGKVKIRNYSFSSNTVADGDGSDVTTAVIWEAGRK